MRSSPLPRLSRGRVREGDCPEFDVRGNPSPQPSPNMRWERELAAAIEKE